MTATPDCVRSREIIEKELRSAEEEVEFAENEVGWARDRLEKLEDELAVLPPHGVDVEIWYARHDRRQLSLDMPLPKARQTSRAAIANG